MVDLRGSVWLVEDEDWDEEGDTFLLGTFSGHHDLGDGELGDTTEGVTVEEGIAWGRARAKRVYIRIGDAGEYCTAGVQQVRGCSVWPPEDLPVLQRRRPFWDSWKDRVDSDPPIPWDVELRLTPPDFALGRAFDLQTVRKRRSRWSNQVRAAAKTAGAQWDSRLLGRFLRELEDLMPPEADGATLMGWSSSASPAYRVRVQVEAPTRRTAMAIACERCPVPAGWEVELGAQPSHGADDVPRAASRNSKPTPR